MDSHILKEEQVSEEDDSNPEDDNPKKNGCSSFPATLVLDSEGDRSKRKTFAKRRSRFSQHVYVKNETTETIYVLLSAIQVQISDTTNGGEVGVPLMSVKFQRAKTWEYTQSKTTAITVLPKEDFRMSLPSGAKGKAFLSCYFHKEGRNVLLFKDFVVKKGYRYTVDKHRLSYPLGWTQVKYSELQQ